MDSSNILLSLDNDPEFKEKMAYYLEKVNKIKVTPQPTEVSLKTLNAMIDDIYSEVIFDYTLVQNQLEDVRSEIRVVLKTSCDGPNEQVRVANGYHHACNYIVDDGTTAVNLFEIESRLRWRVSFLEAVLKLLDQKAQRVLNNIAILKLESTL